MTAIEIFPIRKGSSQQRTPMSPLRKTSLAAGVIYLLTFVSIPTLALYGPIHQPGYLQGNSTDTAIIVGGLLEIVVALTCIGSAVVLYPLLRKQHEVLALGLVASRVLEAGTIFIGVAFLLAVVTLRQAGVGAEAAITSQALVALYDRIFLLGQGFIPAVNDMLLGYMLYKTRLVPRTLSIIGMAGAFPLIAGYLAVMFGIIGQHSLLAGLAAVLVAVFEFSLGIYLIIKGFKSPKFTAGN